MFSGCNPCKSSGLPTSKVKFSGMQVECNNLTFIDSAGYTKIFDAESKPNHQRLDILHLRNRLQLGYPNKLPNFYKLHQLNNLRVKETSFDKFSTGTNL